MKFILFISLFFYSFILHAEDSKEIQISYIIKNQNNDILATINSTLIKNDSIKILNNESHYKSSYSYSSDKGNIKTYSILKKSNDDFLIKSTFEDNEIINSITMESGNGPVSIPETENKILITKSVQPYHSEVFIGNLQSSLLKQKLYIFLKVE